jgi:hypothetical protein
MKKGIVASLLLVILFLAGASYSVVANCCKNGAPCCKAQAACCVK